MKKLTIIFIASLALAAEAPKQADQTTPAVTAKLPDDLLYQYWRIVAENNQDMALYLQSVTADQKHLAQLGESFALSPEQKKMQEKLTADSKAIEAVRQKLQAACPKEAPVLDDSTKDFTCKAKP